MPHRLRPPTGFVTGFDFPPGFRWRLIRRVPTIFIDYVPELILIVAATVTGLAQISGFSTSTVSRELPQWVVYLYGITLLLGAGTVIVGLILGRYGTIIPMGLRLLAVICVCYALAIMGLVGFRPGIVNIVMSLSLAGLAAWRAFILKSTYLFQCWAAKWRKT